MVNMVLCTKLAQNGVNRVIDGNIFLFMSSYVWNNINVYKYFVAYMKIYSVYEIRMSSIEMPETVRVTTAVKWQKSAQIRCQQYACEGCTKFHLLLMI